MAARIKKGDNVVVISGRDKGRSGEVIRVMPKEGRALVRGVNMVTRHQKQTAAEQGGLVRKEAPIHLSNVAHRRSHRRQADARRIRSSWKTGARCVSPSARERRSMAEAKEAAAGKDAKAGKPAKAGKTAKAAAQPEAGAPRPKSSAGYEPRLQKYYREVVVPKLNEQFGYKNPHSVPRIDKIVLNMGVGEVDRRHQEGDARGRGPGHDRRAEAGDHARAQVDRHLQAARGHADRRQGDTAQATACTSSSTGWSRWRCRACATSAGSSPKSFDGRGNFALGIKEHIIFPEINYDKVDQVWGMDVVVCTTAQHRRRGAGAARRHRTSRSGSSWTKRGLGRWLRRARSRRTTAACGWRSSTPPSATKLKAAAVDPNLGDQEHFAARLKLTELPRNSSPQQGAQSLRDHRPSARQLPQAQDDPHRAARHGQRRARSPAW